MSSNAVTPPAQGLDSSVFRTACGKFATGITIVTVTGEDGLPYGMTANSFTSVSLDPPLVLVCIDRKATLLSHLQGAKSIGINVLREDQQDLSTQFARRGSNRFETAEWFAGETGAPILNGVLAYFECVVIKIVEGGDHLIFIADVRNLKCSEGRPLLYFASGYRTLA